MRLPAGRIVSSRRLKAGALDVRRESSSLAHPASPLDQLSSNFKTSTRFPPPDLAMPPKSEKPDDVAHLRVSEADKAIAAARAHQQQLMRVWVQTQKSKLELEFARAVLTPKRH